MNLLERLDDPAPPEPTTDRLDAIEHRHQRLRRRRSIWRASIAAIVVGVLVGVAGTHLIDRGSHDIVTTAGLPAMTCGPAAPTRIYNPRIDTDPTTQAVTSEITHAMPVTVQVATRRPFVTVSAACGTAVLDVQDYRTHNAGPQVPSLNGPPATTIGPGPDTPQPAPQPLGHLPSGFAGSVTRTSPSSASITILKRTSPGGLAIIRYDTSADSTGTAISPAILTRIEALAIQLITNGPYTDN